MAPWIACSEAALLGAKRESQTSVRCSTTVWRGQTTAMQRLDNGLGTLQDDEQRCTRYPVLDRVCLGKPSVSCCPFETLWPRHTRTLLLLWLL
jgi:hypothetical protein